MFDYIFFVYWQAYDILKSKFPDRDLNDMLQVVQVAIFSRKITRDQGAMKIEYVGLSFYLTTRVVKYRNPVYKKLAINYGMLILSIFIGNVFKNKFDDNTTHLRFSSNFVDV